MAPGYLFFQFGEADGQVLFCVLQKRELVKRRLKKTKREQKSKLVRMKIRIMT